MKRCPECEFLYEDEQECCDMDGTVLRFTSFVPSFAPPQPARKDPKPIWSGLAIPLLGLVVIGSVLVTLYRATPTQSSSSSVTGDQATGANQFTNLPVSNSPEVAAPANPARRAEPSLVPATRARDPFAKPSRPGQSTDDKRPTIEPATRVQMEPSSSVSKPPKPAPGQTSPPPAASPKAVARSNTISVPPKPSPDKPTPQSKTQNQDKDSKVKSLFKKAGRILKKPF